MLFRSEEVKVEKVLTSKTNKENNLLIKIKDFFNSGSEVSKLVIIIIFVSFAFGLFYGVGALINDAKSENKEEENTNVTIQYNEILLGNLFDQKENAYYVLVYERDDTYKSLYFNYLNTISNTEKDFGIYSSDLNIAFNKKFVGDTDVFVDNIKNLKVSSTALLKIENKKVVEIFEKRSDIVSKLKSLTK